MEHTVIVAGTSHWKWRETKLQPSRARTGHQISCCLVSLHFLCDILAPITVHKCTVLVLRMAHSIWKETKQQPGIAGPGNMLGCSLVSFHFLWVILSTSTVRVLL